VDLTDMYPYDPDKARELLAEAGYPDGFETTITFANFDLHRRNAEIIASQLAQVGIKATLQSMELATWLDQVYRGRDYELNTLSHSGRLDPDPFLNRLTCDSKENYRNYCNPQFDELIRQGASTTDVAKRKEIYAKAQRLLAEDAASVWLYTPHVILGAQRNVHGYTFRPISGMDFRGVWKSSP
jgi:peptide/nickel transport system substrate-binding protein